MKFSQTPVNLHFSSGSTFSKTFVVRNDDYSPMNLERTEIKGAMAKHPAALDADISTSTNPVYKIIPLDVTMTNPIGGEYTIGLSSEDSQSIPEGKYVYNVVMNGIDGTVTNIMSGLIFVDSSFASLT